MRQGKYWNFKSRYQEENWSICLELFDDNSEVMLINECSHTFHSKWLEDWFWNIKIEQDLKWPLCWTVVSPLFKRMQSNLLPTDLSMVREINEQDESKNELNDAAYYR